MPDMPLAVDLSHAPQSFWENDFALVNMKSMMVTLDTSHLERSPLKDEAELNMPRMVVTFDTAHLDRSPLNDVVR